MPKKKHYIQIVNQLKKSATHVTRIKVLQLVHLDFVMWGAIQSY